MKLLLEYLLLTGKAQMHSPTDHREEKEIGCCVLSIRSLGDT